jgi:hypothetical protein
LLKVVFEDCSYDGKKIIIGAFNNDMKRTLPYLLIPGQFIFGFSIHAQTSKLRSEKEPLWITVNNIDTTIRTWRRRQKMDTWTLLLRNRFHLHLNRVSSKKVIRYYLKQGCKTVERSL